MTQSPGQSVPRRLPAALLGAVAMGGAVLGCPPGAAAQGRTASDALPDPPGVLDELARQLGDGTRLLRTAHYLILYDGADRLADARASILEQTHDAYYRELRRAGFDPQPLRQRLVCLIFTRHADYLEHAREREHARGAVPDAFYAPRTNRIVMFNQVTDPRLDAYRARINQLHREVAQLRGESVASPQARGALRVKALELARLEAQLNRRAGLTNVAHTVHEAVHQLAFNSGLQRHAGAKPMWVTEGLATAFETPRPVGAFGPRDLNRVRLHRLRQAARAGRLLGLADLARLTSLSEIEAGVSRDDCYAQSWGLFHYLYRHRSDALQRYMRTLRDLPHDSPPEALERAFADAFGPPARLEARWRGWLGEQR